MSNNPIEIQNKELLQKFNEFLNKKIGFLFEDKDFDKLQSRLQSRLNHLAIDSLDEYYKRLLFNEDELLELINHIIVNETTFFRHEDQYAILLNLIKKYYEKSSQINILSAGCSTGEEPYSIAMYLKTHLPPQLFDKARITAMDISSFNIKIAQRGIYPQLKIDKVKDKNALKLYFTKCADGDNYELIPSIRTKVAFYMENLFTVSFRVKYNFIFCRNVMIYFSEEKRNMLIEKFSANLTDNGYIFLAPTESLLEAKNLFERLRENEVTYYRNARFKSADKDRRERQELRQPNDRQQIADTSAADSGAANKSKPSVEYDLKILDIRDKILEIECSGVFEKTNISAIKMKFKTVIFTKTSNMSRLLKPKTAVLVMDKVRYIDAAVLKELGLFLKSEFVDLEKLFVRSDKEQIMRIFEFHELDGIFELQKRKE